MKQDDSLATWQDILQSLHQSPFQIALVLTGGGSGAIAECFQYAGASSSFLEATFPYARESLREYLGAETAGASASLETAQEMAQRARERATSFVNHHADAIPVGISLTAALPTVPKRHVSNRIHVARISKSNDAQHSAETTSWSVTIDESQTRESSEKICVAMIRNAIANLLGHETMFIPEAVRSSIETTRSFVT